MIVGLSLVVTLWIVGGGEPMGDLVLETEAHHLLAREVGPIVRDDGMGKPEGAHDIFDNLFPLTSESGTTFTHVVK